MSRVTCTFLILAIIYAVSCAPIDDSTSVKPSTPKLDLSTPTTTDVRDKHKGHQHSSSEESKESDESSEEVKKRPVRDTPKKDEKTQETTHENHSHDENSPALLSELSNKEQQVPVREMKKTEVAMDIPKSDSSKKSEQSSSNASLAKITQLN